MRIVCGPGAPVMLAVCPHCQVDSPPTSPGPANCSRPPRVNASRGGRSNSYIVTFRRLTSRILKGQANALVNGASRRCR
jgi:hypothetical protein